MRPDLLQQLLLALQHHAVGSGGQGAARHEVSEAAALVVAGVHDRKTVELEEGPQHRYDPWIVLLHLPHPLQEELGVEHVGVRVGHAHHLDLHRVERLGADLAYRLDLLLEGLRRSEVDEVGAELDAVKHEFVVLQERVEVADGGGLAGLHGVEVVDVLQRRRLRVGLLALQHLRGHCVEQLLAHLDGEDHKVSLVGRLGQRAEVLRPDAGSVEEAVAAHGLAALLHAVRHQHSAHGLQGRCQDVHLGEGIKRARAELHDR
mmetsp:Transcript_249/g.800  ORF Transcript_249/g.800 Transcript_249/m.800 type:complete len:261 (-) Transcript_249:1248-2030(-)